MTTPAITTEDSVRISRTVTLTYDQAKPTEQPTFPSDHGVARGKPRRNFAVQTLRLRYIWDADARIWRSSIRIAARPWLASGGLGSQVDLAAHGYYSPGESELENWARGEAAEHAPTVEPIVTWAQRR